MHQPYVHCISAWCNNRKIKQRKRQQCKWDGLGIISLNRISETHTHQPPQMRCSFCTKQKKDGKMHLFVHMFK